MPLSRDTLRIKARKDELEKKLRETDSAIKIFSRERVFIKIDDWEPVIGWRICMNRRRIQYGVLIFV